MKSVREAAWAGQFYPANPSRLSAQINKYIDAAPDLGVKERLIGIIVPHAGYEYSGATAAVAYRQTRGMSYKTVFVLAPSHAEFFSGVSVYEGDYYRTPLGSVPVDREIAAAITGAHPEIRLSDKGHRTSGSRPEHALEVQIPFLQTALGGEFKVVPIVFHDFSIDTCRLLGRAMAQSFDPENMLMVASSDLYHGYSYEECQKADDKTVNRIIDLDVEEFCRGAALDLYPACGAGPISSVLIAAIEHGPVRVTLAARTNSADVTGTRGGWTVGYASFLINRIPA